MDHGWYSMGFGKRGLRMYNTFCYVRKCKYACTKYALHGTTSWLQAGIGTYKIRHFFSLFQLVWANFAYGYYFSSTVVYCMYMDPCAG